MFNIRFKFRFKFILFIGLFLSLFANSSLNASIGENNNKFSNIKTKQYKVRRGDNLWMIAKRNRPSRNVATVRMLAAIQAMNKESLVNNAALHAGMKLILPITSNGVYKILHKDGKKDKKADKKADEIISNNNLDKGKVITNTKDKSLDKNISAVSKVIDTPKVKSNIKNSQNSQNSDSNNAWILLTVFFMFTSMFLYWRMRKLSEGNSRPQGSAARRLGVRSRDNNRFNNSANHMQVSMPTRSEPKLNIQVNDDELLNIDDRPENYNSVDNNNPLDELARIKTRIHAAPESVDLRLDLLRKLVQLDDQEGFKKSVDELTPLLTEAHQTVWSDIRSMYFGKWAYDS